MMALLGCALLYLKKILSLLLLEIKLKDRLKKFLKTISLFLKKGSFVLIAYKSFVELSFKEASVEIVNAVKSSVHNKV